MIDFSKVTSVTIPEGSVIKISDSDGVVYWQKKIDIHVTDVKSDDVILDDGSIVSASKLTDEQKQKVSAIVPFVNSSTNKPCVISVKALTKLATPLPWERHVKDVDNSDNEAAYMISGTSGVWKTYNLSDKYYSYGQDGLIPCGLGNFNAPYSGNTGGPATKNQYHDYVIRDLGGVKNTKAWFKQIESIEGLTLDNFPFLKSLKENLGDKYYVPSAGEMSTIMTNENIAKINTMLQNLGFDYTIKTQNAGYWTSTISSVGYDENSSGWKKCSMCVYWFDSAGTGSVDSLGVGTSKLKALPLPIMALTDDNNSSETSIVTKGDVMTLDEFNEKNPRYSVSVVDVLQKGLDTSTDSYRRIPNVMIGNDGSLHVVCESRPSTADTANTGVVYARKSPTSDKWEYQTMLRYGQTPLGNVSKIDNEKFMNPSMVVDRQGVHGEKGRIYMFALAYNSSAGTANNASSDMADSIYSYSDDNGKTWLEWASIRGAWENKGFTSSFVSCNHGIQLTDGTLVMPCMGVESSTWHSGILYKKAGVDTPWVFSKLTSHGGDNECAVYEGDEPNSIYINCRSGGSEGWADNRNIYKYDMENDSWTSISNSFNPILETNADIVKVDGMYVMAFDYLNKKPSFSLLKKGYDYRKNYSLWVSKDGLSWKRSFQIMGTDHYGYGNLSYHNGKLSCVFENGTYASKNPYAIAYVDLTNVIPQLKSTYGTI